MIREISLAIWKSFQFMEGMEGGPVFFWTCAERRSGTSLPAEAGGRVGKDRGSFGRALIWGMGTTPLRVSVARFEESVTWRTKWLFILCSSPPHPHLSVCLKLLLKALSSDRKAGSRARGARILVSETSILMRGARNPHLLGTLRF